MCTGVCTGTWRATREKGSLRREKTEEAIAPSTANSTHTSSSYRHASTHSTRTHRHARTQAHRRAARLTHALDGRRSAHLLPFPTDHSEGFGWGYSLATGAGTTRSPLLPPLPLRFPFSLSHRRCYSIGIMTSGEEIGFREFIIRCAVEMASNLRCGARGATRFDAVALLNSPFRTFSIRDGYYTLPRL